MATTTDARTIAGTLYEMLIGSVAEQLRAAAPRLAQLNGSGPELQQQIMAALPAGTLPQVSNFVLGLAREGLLSQIVEISEAFESFGRNAPARPLDALVTSAVPLSAAQQARISEDLRQRNGEVTVQFAVDETLIGGLIIRIGDQVLDNSLRTRLGVIQRNMLAS